MQKYKVVVTIPAIIEVTAETAHDANELVKEILVGHEETKNADVIQSAVHKPFGTVAKTHMYRRCTSVNSLPETDYKKKITVLCKEAVV